MKLDKVRFHIAMKSADAWDIEQIKKLEAKVEAQAKVMREAIRRFKIYYGNANAGFGVEVPAMLEAALRGEGGVDGCGI